jgi:transcriptional regulator with XRE-family HTH domain
MALPMTLGEQFKRIRADKGLSQPELSEIAGIEQSYLSKLENDKSLPSSEVLRKLLKAFQLSIEELITPLDNSYIKRHLLVISDIEQLYQKSSNKKLSLQRNFLYLSSALIVLAVTLFYIGYAKQIFNETLYEYRSDGVVLAGEPSDIFRKWRNLIDNSDPRKHREILIKKSIMMAQRSDILVKLITENKGASFVEVVEGGNRFFHKSIQELPIIYPRAINAWLQVVGVLLLISGLMGFVLERRLFKLSH